jgi:hypothetical protein
MKKILTLGFLLLGLQQLSGAAVSPRWPHFLKFMFRISAPRSWKGKNRSVSDHRGRGFPAKGAASPVRKIDPMTGEVIAIMKP